MKHILLPTDFSENSWNAIKYALQLFKDKDCNFTLLNTYTPIIYQFEYIQSSTIQLQVMDSIKEHAKTGLKDMMERINREFNNSKHSFSQIASFNTLMTEINDLTTENQFDLIVLGTKGASGLKEVLFGSNTVSVLNKAKCPVLAIPSGFEFEEPHEILFPSDYGIDFKDSHVEPIMEICKLYRSRLNILHVNYGNYLTENQMDNKDNLEYRFINIPHLFHEVSNQNIPEAIGEFQLKTRVNLLTMINNKHSFFENLFFKSNINQIGFHLNIPFLNKNRADCF